MESFKKFNQGDIPNISHWKKQSERLGSNPGGIFHDESNNKHYVKFYNNPQQARSEVAASKIYNLMGLHTLDHKLVNYKGKLGVATAWRTDLKPMGEDDYNNVGEDTKNQIAKSMHAAILTKNWDSVGLDFDNISKDSNGNLVHLDMGGVFKYRAQGGPKEYGGDINEIHSLMDKNINYSAHHVFSKINNEHHKKALDTTSKLDPSKVANIFHETGVADPIEHASNLIRRRDNLIRHFN